MALPVLRYRIPTSAIRFAPRFAPWRQFPAAIAVPQTPHAPLFTTRIGSHISIRMAHSSTHAAIDPSQTVEEETLRGYKAEHYYPVNIGDVFQDR
jgi:hypothetical protein